MLVRTGACIAALAVFCLGCGAAPPERAPVMPPIAPEPERFALLRRLDRADVGLGESSFPVGCALSPDGQRLAVPSQPPLIWDFALDRPLLRLTGDEAYPLAVAFGASSNELAVGTLSGVDFWDLARKEKQSVADEDGTTGYRLADDGQVVALLNLALGNLSLFRTTDHTRFAHINRNGRWGGAKSGQFPEISLAGGRVAVPLDTAVEIFDVRDGSLAKSIPAPYIVEAVALSPDGAQLAVALTDSIALHDLANPEHPRSAPIAHVSALWLTPNTLIYGTDAGEIGALDLATLEPVATMAGAHHGRVACVSARGERTISAAVDGGAALWKTPRPRARR